MDLYCVYCGQSLPQDASFCSRCGRGNPFNLAPFNIADTRALSEIRHTSYTSPVPAVLETCEIGWSRRAHGLSARITFHAEKALFGDRQIIASSEPVSDARDNISGRIYIPRETDEAMAAVSQLVERLLQDGWQPISHGNYWWNYRFSRPTGN
jgi:hypothetical protein